MTGQAQIRRRVGAQHELEIALMGIVAASALARCDRLMDVVSRRQDVADVTQLFRLVAQLELMQVGLQLYVTRIAVADVYGPVYIRFALQGSVAIVVEAGLILHINGWRALRGGQKRNDNETENATHDSDRPTVDEKFSSTSDQQPCRALWTRIYQTHL